MRDIRVATTLLGHLPIDLNAVKRRYSWPIEFEGEWWQDPWAAQCLRRVYVREFWPRVISDTLVLRLDDLLAAGVDGSLERVANLIQCQIEVAVASIEWFATEEWTKAVLPAEIPSGE